MAVLFAIFFTPQHTSAPNSRVKGESSFVPRVPFPSQLRGSPIRWASQQRNPCPLLSKLLQENVGSNNHDPIIGYLIYLTERGYPDPHECLALESRAIVVGRRLIQVLLVIHTNKAKHGYRFQGTLCSTICRFSHSTNPLKCTFIPATLHTRR